MRVVQPAFMWRVARPSRLLHATSELSSNSLHLRSLHTSPAARTSTPPPPLPKQQANTTPAAEGTLQKARQWLQAQPPALRYTLVGVFTVLATLESSFWCYNAYLRVQRYQQDKRSEAEEAAAETVAVER